MRQPAKKKIKRPVEPKAKRDGTAVKVKRPKTFCNDGVTPNASCPHPDRRAPATLV